MYIAARFLMYPLNSKISRNNNKPYGIRKYIKKKPFIELYVLPAIYPDQKLDKKQATEKLKNDVYLKMKQELES